MRLSRETTVAVFVAGRTAACADWPRADGKTTTADPRRTLRRARPRRSRTFFAIPGAPGPSAKSSDTGARDASRGGNHAGVLARADPEIRPRAGLREKINGTHGETSRHRVRHPGEAGQEGRPVCPDSRRGLPPGGLKSRVAEGCQSR